MKIKNKALYEYAVITAGIFLLALAISIFFERKGLVTGGVTGFAIIVQYWTKNAAFTMPIWLTNLAINVPLFFMGLKIKGFKFMVKTMYGTLVLSLFLYLISYAMMYREDNIDIINSAIFGGVLAGAGLGLIIKHGSTTGGTDLLAVILNKYFKNISISVWIFILDSVIILIGVFVFGANRAMYAIITVFIASKVITMVQMGISFNKSIMIISDESQEISKKLIEEHGYGVTSLIGKGMYSNKEKEVLICVVSSKNVYKVIATIENIDENAFIILSDAREVIGEGFRPTEKI
jgi:uncharacterized membrane-anchored protein YitT (DUF2179 family)